MALAPPTFIVQTHWISPTGLSPKLWPSSKMEKHSSQSLVPTRAEAVLFFFWVYFRLEKKLEVIESQKQIWEWNLSVFMVTAAVLYLIHSNRNQKVVSGFLNTQMAPFSGSNLWGFMPWLKHSCSFKGGHYPAKYLMMLVDFMGYLFRWIMSDKLQW